MQNPCFVFCENGVIEGEISSEINQDKSQYRNIKSIIQLVRTYRRGRGSKTRLFCVRTN